MAKDGDFSNVKVSSQTAECRNAGADLRQADRISYTASHIVLRERTPMRISKYMVILIRDILSRHWGFEE